LNAWKWRPAPVSNSWILNDIDFGGGIYVAVGGSDAFPQSPLILTSHDGVVWTVRMNAAADSTSLGDVCFGNGLFVAVGGAFVGGAVQPRILTSTNGLQWTQRPSGASGGLAGIAWGGGRFVGVGENGVVVTSPDGLNWTSGSIGSASYFHDVTYGNGLYVTVGESGAVFTSTNGVNWAARDLGVSTPFLYDVTFGNDLFVSVGFGGGIFTSANGVNWTPRPSGTPEHLFGITAAAGRFVAAGANNFTNRNTILISSNGIHWEAAAVPLRAGFGFLREVGYGNGTFIAVGDNGSIATWDVGGPTIFTQPASQQVHTAATATFAVSAVTTNPPLRYQWRFNGADLLGKTNETLSVAEAQIPNIGTYQVVVSDGVGSTLSAVVRLDLFDALFITSQPRGAATRAGSNVTFSVVAYGTGPLQYQWWRNGTEAPGATNSVLLVTNVQAAQLGDYSVVVSNPYGSVTSSVVTLTFLTPPFITEPPQSVTVFSGENATFTITVTNTATLPVTYSWRKGSTILTNIVLHSRTCSFTLFNVQTNVTLTNGPGNYRVAVSNAASSGSGFASPFAELRVQQAVQRPAIIRYALQPGGLFHLQISGTTGASYTVLASTNLLDWRPLGPAAETTAGSFEFTDADTPGHAQRFYRVRSP
jgi:hypothetical protein